MRCRLRCANWRRSGKDSLSTPLPQELAICAVRSGVRHTDAAGLGLHCSPLRARLHEEPVQAVRAQRARLREAEQAAAEVVAHVVQVRVHGVRAPPEVQVVRVVHDRLIPELLRHLPACADRLIRLAR